MDIKFSAHGAFYGTTEAEMYNCKFIAKNIDIKFNPHTTFLELISSGTLKIERLESQII